jgi:hypothetical protein
MSNNARGIPGEPSVLEIERLHGIPPKSNGSTLDQYVHDETKLSFWHIPGPFEGKGLQDIRFISTISSLSEGGPSFQT